MKKMITYLKKIKFRYYTFKRKYRLRNFSGEIFSPISFKDINLSILLNRNNGIVDEEIYSKGTFDLEVLDCIYNNINEESVFIDVGANIGYISLCISPFVKEVHSFEPNPILIEQFAKTIKQNNISNIIQYPYGCGNCRTNTTLYLEKNNIGASSILSQSNSQSIQIEIIRLDDLIDNFNRIDFIKIDVEGYETFVIDGTFEIIKKFNPHIILEFSPLIYERTQKGLAIQFLQKLLKLPYTIFNLNDNNKIIQSPRDLDLKKTYNLFLQSNLLNEQS